MELTQFVMGLDDKSDEQILDYTEQLTNLALRGGAYHEFMAIYGLKEPQWWENMTLLGETNLREHKLRNAASKKLRHAWRQLHHGKKEKATSVNDEAEGTSKGISDRSTI